MKNALLDGIRVVDFTQYLPGPFATQRLVDFGAEVIKIEALQGDPARHMGEAIAEAGVVFIENNRGKKSVALNLKSKEGRTIALRLIAKSDIVIESFRPQVMSKLGLSYEDVKRVKQDIIYCSLSGYGQSGPASNLASHDINYLALSGILTQLSDEEGRPVQPTVQLADLIGGIVANEAILAALTKRTREGLGSYLDLSLLDAMNELMNNHRKIYALSGKQDGIPLIDGSVISYHIYETKDNRFVSLGALEFKFWQNFCQALHKEDWLQAHYSRAKADNPIYLEVIDVFKSKSLEEWTEFGFTIDCCLTPILETLELEDHAITKAAAPLLAEHTDQLLTELLHVNETELQQWKERGIIL